MKTGRAHPIARTASQNGGLKRVDMIAAVLKRHPGLAVREMIAALDKEFGWRITESGVTAHRYTNRNKYDAHQVRSLYQSFGHLVTEVGCHWHPGGTVRNLPPPRGGNERLRGGARGMEGTDQWREQGRVVVLPSQLRRRGSSVNFNACPQGRWPFSTKETILSIKIG